MTHTFIAQKITQQTFLRVPASTWEKVCLALYPLCILLPVWVLQPIFQIGKAPALAFLLTELLGDIALLMPLCVFTGLRLLKSARTFKAQRRHNYITLVFIVAMFLAAVIWLIVQCSSQRDLERYVATSAPLAIDTALFALLLSYYTMHLRTARP